MNLRPILENRNSAALGMVLLGLVLVCLTGCQRNIGGILQPMQPKDFLNPPSIIDPGREFGHIKTATVIVSATTDIFLAGAEKSEILEYPEEGLRDKLPDHAPVKILEGVIVGGETLDIYASGKARHLPLRSISYGPRGWTQLPPVQLGPALRIREVTGYLGSLVGMFDNERDPFVIGSHKQIEVPRGARFLYLAVLDYPGASSNNEGEYTCTIEVIRR